MCKPYAVGTLTGKLGKRTIKRSNVAMPVRPARAASPRRGDLPVVHLDLGPLNLNLLGLDDHLNQVVLDVNAVSGPGNLLGNVLVLGGRATERPDGDGLRRSRAC